MPNFVYAVVVIGLGAAAASQPGPQLHCIGELAHVVSDGGEGNLVVAPAPERNAECITGGLGIEHGGDRLFCVGANENEQCTGARRDALPLPFAVECKQCFAAATTDVFYSVNMSGFHLHHVAVGFRGTRLRAKVDLVDDKGRYKPKQGSLTIFSKPLRHKIAIAGKVLAEFSLSLPTEMFYKFWERAGEHLGAGASLDIDLGENSVRYEHGKGWSHRSDKARVKVQHQVEGDYSDMTNLTVGVKSTLEVNVSQVMWFRAKAGIELPLSFTSTGTTGGDLIHTCASGGMDFGLSHEADLSIKHPFKVEHHWGPKLDRHSEHPDLFRKCVDVHPKRPTLVV